MLTAFASLLLLASAAPFAVSDDHNPIGVSGVFEGVIMTGRAYNALNHNARREIDDIVVPGSIGKYPLKMTRYYNSRATHVGGTMGPGWTHEYQWGSFNWKVTYANGNVLDGECFPPLGVSDGWQATSCIPTALVTFDWPTAAQYTLMTPMATSKREPLRGTRCSLKSNNGVTLPVLNSETHSTFTQPQLLKNNR